MTKTKVYIDGSEGTTGLRINERFEGREDIEILKIASELRKDPEERKKFINASDITFLCLPDAASIEAVSLIEKDNDHTVMIDASTAHRTEEGWAYGLPELGETFREKIRTGNRIAVPGCYASGFLMDVYPLIQMGFIDEEYPVCVNALSGYSGAGKKAIALYESPDKTVDLEAPRMYALTQKHKHLKEMQAIPGLSKKPCFNPYVCDFLEGMLVTIPLFVDLLNKPYTPMEIHKLLSDYYNGKDFVRVMPYNDKGTEDGFLAANHLDGKDYLEIYVSGNEERINITACLDNLGKGASGAALECMNIMLGLDPKTSLNL